MTDPDGAAEPAGETDGGDPSLRLPELPGLSRDLGSPGFPLQRSALLDRDPPFTIPGARVRVGGGHARGVDEVRASRIRLVARLRVADATTAASTLTPVGLERRLETGAGAVVERIAIPSADPVCFFEWVTDPDLPLVVTWRIPAPVATRDGAAGAIRWRRADRGLLVAIGEERSLYVFSRAPSALTVTPALEGGQAAGLDVRARLEPGSGRPVRLAVAGIAPGDDEARVLRVMDRCHVVVPARRAEAHRIVEDRLGVDAWDEGLGDALAWSMVRLAVREPPALDTTAPLSDRAVRLTLAALASGDPTPARTLLTGPATAAVGIDPADGARYLLVAARYLAWTGDLGAVNGAWDALRASAETCLRAVAADPDRDDHARADHDLMTGALAELVVVAEETGDAALTRRLRAAVGEPGAPVDMARRTAAAGSDPGPDADGDGAPDARLRAAALIEAVVHGLLGAVPDAPRGRLVLRPRLPAGWTRFAVRNLAVGGADVSMDYDRDGGVHRFRLRQERGAAPLRVILEPELAGRRVAAARVDGEPAGLDPVTADGRVRVPVQLVLDHERRVEVEIEGPNA